MLCWNKSDSCTLNGLWIRASTAQIQSKFNKLTEIGETNYNERDIDWGRGKKFLFKIYLLTKYKVAVKNPEWRMKENGGRSVCKSGLHYDHKLSSHKMYSGSRLYTLFYWTTLDLVRHSEWLVKLGDFTWIWCQDITLLWRCQILVPY